MSGRRLPNAAQAIVDPANISNYLMQTSPRRVNDKSGFSAVLDSGAKPPGRLWMPSSGTHRIMTSRRPGSRRMEPFLKSKGRSARLMVEIRKSW
jgi:hypothetical protein